MSGVDRVRKLEALLALVQRNRPRPLARAAAASVASPTTPTPATVTSRPSTSVTATPPMPFAVSQPAPPAFASPSVAPPTAPPPAASWAPEPGSATQARSGTMPPASLPPHEVTDDDLLEVTTIPPDAGPSAPVDRTILEPDAAEVSEVTEVADEGAPISSNRFRVPVTLDDALAGAGDHETEHEVRVQTPPPESGPQEALPPLGLEAARTPDVDQLEADLDLPPSMGPTAEQLGETIELEAPRGPELEIDITVEDEPLSREPTPHEELEVALPRPSLPSGLYDLTAPPPEQATSPVEPRAADSPERVARPALGATDVARVSLAPSASARSFVELVDASLGL